jgi:hypothetical protein
VWIGFDWLRIGTDGGLLWVRWWTFGFLRHGVNCENEFIKDWSPVGMKQEWKGVLQFRVRIVSNCVHCVFGLDVNFLRLKMYCWKANYTTIWRWLRYVSPERW